MDAERKLSDGGGAHPRRRVVVFSAIHGSLSLASPRSITPRLRAECHPKSETPINAPGALVSFSASHAHKIIAAGFLVASSCPDQRVRPRPRRDGPMEEARSRVPRWCRRTRKCDAPSPRAASAACGGQSPGPAAPITRDKTHHHLSAVPLQRPDPPLDLQRESMVGAWEGPASRSRGGSPACLLLLVWRWGLRRVSCPAGPAASACARPSWPFSRSFSPVLPVAIRRSIQRLRLS